MICSGTGQDGAKKASDGEQRKPIKVAMEAMLRGFEKFAEGGESGGGGANCSHKFIMLLLVTMFHARKYMHMAFRF